MKLNSKFLISLVFTAFTLFPTFPVLAQDTIDITPSGNYAVLNDYKPSQFVTTAINMLLGAGGVMAFIYLLWGGIQWVTAGGDKDGIDKAKRKIMNALIGLAIVFSSYTILYVIRVLFNINLIQLQIKTIGT